MRAQPAPAARLTCHAASDAVAVRYVVGPGWTTGLSSITSAKPTTEITVSITDQDLIVSPTVRPKYSLTSQKPASLTWLKNSDPHPIASTSSARLVRGQVGASGPTMPAAVMVATVAEPVTEPDAATATSHPSSSTEMFAPVGPVLDDLADARVDRGSA